MSLDHVHCKLCFDAGKSELEYMSHYVRDRAGKTTCPLLLSIKCRLCNATGHTPKHCPGIKPLHSPVRKERLAVVPEKPKKLQPVKGFASLAYETSSSDDDEPAPDPYVDTWSKYAGVDWNDIESGDNK